MTKNVNEQPQPLITQSVLQVKQNNIIEAFNLAGNEGEKTFK